MIKKISLMVIPCYGTCRMLAHEIQLFGKKRERRNLRIGECLDNRDGTASCKNEYGDVIRVPIRR